jgi:copper chaperone
MKEIVLTVPDMSCNHCVSSITSALRGLAGVSEVKVDLAKKAVVVIFEERVINEAQIRQTLDAIGFEAQ